MIRNDNIVLGNNNKIFKSQALFSYIEDNSYYNYYMYLGTSGITSNNPLYVYRNTPTGVQKFKFTTDRSISALISFIYTYDSSWKKNYIFGNLNSVYYIRYYTSGSYLVRGDLQKNMDQFSNLETLIIENSQFNKNINYINFPQKLKELYLYDTTLSGNINTFNNLENIEKISLTNCLFTGQLDSVGFNNLKYLYAYSLGNLNCNLNNLFDDNLDLNFLHLYNTSLFSGNLTNIDVSNLNYIYMMFVNNTSITGNITNWSFNTGLTVFSFYTVTTNNKIFGDLTNWDFSNTNMTQFLLHDNVVKNNITGDLSNWVLPDTLNTFQINSNSGITEIPQDFSNTNLSSFSLYKMYALNHISGCTFPSTINSIYLTNNPYIIDDINDLQINCLNITISQSKLFGNIHEYTIPSLTNYLNFNSNQITGYFSGITFNNIISTLVLSSNLMYGNVVGVVLPSSLITIEIAYNSNQYLDFNYGTFVTNNLVQFNFSNCSGVTGDLSNFIFSKKMTYLSFQNTHIYSDINNLSPYNVSTLYLDNCQLICDITNWLTGSTSSTGSLGLSNNPSLSGNTNNWNVNLYSYLSLSNTALSGRLKHNNIYQLYINNTSISSNINEDFNLSGTSFYVLEAYNSNIYGTLSGITLNKSFQTFMVHNNPNIVGSNEFIDYLFVYRKDWTTNYRKTVYIYNIGDTVTGTTESIGDLGTYTGHQWDLTEEQVNNLHIGTDYDGQGTNILWTSKQKIYWIREALISSSSTSRRYALFRISY